MRLPLLLIPVLLAACVSAPPAPLEPCAKYCSSREDGYQWAQRAHLGDARSCVGYPAAFIAGCQDAVMDLQQALAPGRDGL
ncbi:MAG: hypothetical protein E6R07_10040 [Nevskiaceae bacterium]|nr:MAG: hypothetical protein E6R07_10040 [Nevskiaceae bacterium]